MTMNWSGDEASCQETRDPAGADTTQAQVETWCRGAALLTCQSAQHWQHHAASIALACALLARVEVALPAPIVRLSTHLFIQHSVTRLCNHGLNHGPFIQSFTHAFTHTFAHHLNSVPHPHLCPWRVHSHTVQVCALATDMGWVHTTDCVHNRTSDKRQGCY